MYPRERRYRGSRSSTGLVLTRVSCAAKAHASCAFAAVLSISFVLVARGDKWNIEGNHKCVEVLIQNDADVNIKDRWGQVTPELL
jgi:hypothetical protein